MGKRRTGEEIKKEVNDLGYNFIKEYRITNHIKVIVSDKDGYKYDVGIENIRHHGVHLADKTNPFSLENISLWLKLNNKNFELCGKNIYIDATKDLSFYCFNCNGIFYMHWDSISSMGCGCPNCNTSKGEYKIKKYLENHSLSYFFQHSFSDCKFIYVLHFDFYIKDYNVCIEYDGKLHYKDVFNNPEEFKNHKKRDKIKTKYCKNNHIKLIRIPYWDFDNIESILQKELF